LDARLERLRDRLRRGDPDLAEDELLGLIKLVEGKRRDLEAVHVSKKVPGSGFSLIGPSRWLG
jgi:hypothetical protein